MTSTDKILGKLETGIDFLKDQMREMREHHNRSFDRMHRDNLEFKRDFKKHMETEETQLKEVKDEMRSNHKEVKQDILHLRVDVTRLESQSFLGMLKKIWGVIKK